MTLFGTITWNGSTEDPIESFDNIHLANYLRNDTNPSHYAYWIAKSTEIHFVAFLNDPPIVPNDIWNYSEVIIPRIGIDVPQYNYSFNVTMP